MLFHGRFRKIVFRAFRVGFVTILAFLAIVVLAVFYFSYFLPKPGKINYGVNFSPYYAKEELGLNWKDTYISMLDDLGAKNLRLVAYWNRIESFPDVYDFSDLDWQLEEAEKRGANVILTIGRKVPRWPECFEPAWALSGGEEYIKGRLLKYLSILVERYRENSIIKYWQVENEPFFPFGECLNLIQDKNFLEEEINFVRALDTKKREVIVQDSGEGGYWPVTYGLGDYLAISMYRRILFDFWILPKEIYFKYPLPSWSYRAKARLFGISPSKIIVTELQAEPWGFKPLISLTKKERDLTMDEERFKETITYAQNTGISSLYFWGAEWWYWEKQNGNSFYWNTARDLFN